MIVWFNEEAGQRKYMYFLPCPPGVKRLIRGLRPLNASRRAPTFLRALG